MLLGCEEPRIYTPPLRPLTRETSLGFSVIEFAEGVLEIELLPWQRWLLIHMLELRTDGTLRFRTVVVLIARQNGKSTLSQIIALWFMYVYGVPLVIGTAQDLDVAEEIWQGAVDLVEETPELDALKQHVIRVNGKKSLVLTTGERYKVKAANRRAGRGLTGDLVLLDELREHQSWDAWGAITKTTMARAMALILAMSNAGDSTSIVLRYLRKMAHLALGDPDGINREDEDLRPAEEEATLADDDDSLAIFEWSAAPGSELRDRTAWAQANPSLGHTITERTITSAARTDPEWIFRTEVLCQWSDGTLEGPFPPGAWEASADPDSSRATNATVALGVDVSWDRAYAYVALATVRPDGLYHVELIARRAGTEWLADWLTSPERSADVRGAPVALQARGAPVSGLAAALTEAGVQVVPWGGGDLGGAAGAFYDRVRAAVGEGDISIGLRHRDQPALNLAAATASTRPVGDAWVWDRRGSPTDVSPLVAVTAALWCLTDGMPEPPPVSAYEAARLEVF
ncbi:terminase large subunit domain-containing protein [Kribbella sp. NPDC058245]|uniref:terminase large subunit domain-containing protein n=1 Tax=Kribbella sp. NPDC058245 TaxID=3346399 RepID=UPI0036ECB8DC